MNKEIIEALDKEELSLIEYIGSISYDKNEDYKKALIFLANLNKVNVEATNQFASTNEKESRLGIDRDKIRIDKDKLELEQRKFTHQELCDNKGDDINCRKQKDENTRDMFKILLGVADTILPIIFYGIWMTKGFKFEETGTYTSTTFKNLFGRFRATKK